MMIVSFQAISYSRQMKLIFLLFFIFFAHNIVAETVYKTVDEKGNIIFTDRPSENSEEIKLQELQTIKNPNPIKNKPPTQPKSPLDVGNVYSRFIITNPAQGSGIRNNAGNITISVSLEPSLRPGHNIVFTMDGNEVSKGSANNAEINNLSRGAHTAAARVIDGTGKTLISTSSSFSLLRASQ